MQNSSLFLALSSFPSFSSSPPASPSPLPSPPPSPPLPFVPRIRRGFSFVVGHRVRRRWNLSFFLSLSPFFILVPALFLSLSSPLLPPLLSLLLLVLFLLCLARTRGLLFWGNKACLIEEGEGEGQRGGARDEGGGGPGPRLLNDERRRAKRGAADLRFGCSSEPRGILGHDSLRRLESPGRRRLGKEHGLGDRRSFPQQSRLR